MVDSYYCHPKILDSTEGLVDMTQSTANPMMGHHLSPNMELSTLCAFYGGLLTQRQRMAVQLHCDEDFSLAETAEHLGVSRQNVHDLIARSAHKLYRYENALKLVEQSRRDIALLQQALRSLQSAKAAKSLSSARQHIGEADSFISQTIIYISGEE